MLGMSFKSKNSVISRGVAGTPGNSGNSGRSSTWTGSGSVSGPQLGPTSSGNNILSSGSTKKKSNKNPVASRTGNPSADRILGNPPDLPDLPAGTIQAQARSSRQVREERARRAEAEVARQEAEDAIRNQTIGSQPSLFTPLYTPQGFHFTPQESPTFGCKSRALNLVELTRSPRLLADPNATLDPIPPTPSYIAPTSIGDDADNVDALISSSRRVIQGNRIPIPGERSHG